MLNCGTYTPISYRNAIKSAKAKCSFDPHDLQQLDSCKKILKGVAKQLNGVVQLQYKHRDVSRTIPVVHNVGNVGSGEKKAVHF